MRLEEITDLKSSSCDRLSLKIEKIAPDPENQIGRSAKLQNKASNGVSRVKQGDKASSVPKKAKTN